MTWTNGRCELADGTHLRAVQESNGAWWWCMWRGPEIYLDAHDRQSGRCSTEREAQVAAEKAAGVHVEPARYVTGAQAVESPRAEDARKALPPAVAAQAMDGWMGVAMPTGESSPVWATVEALRAENSALRDTLSATATAIGNGSFASRECSVGFLSKIPKEVAAVMANLRERVKALEGERDEIIDKADAGLGWRSPGKRPDGYPHHTHDWRTFADGTIAAVWSDDLSAELPWQWWTCGKTANAGGFVATKELAIEAAQTAATPRRG